MRRRNSLLYFIILLVIIGFVAWLFIPGASNWINRNLTISLTILAIIILTFVGIRFVVEKINTASKKTVDVVLVIIAVGCLFWIYVIPVLPTWFNNNLIPIVITCVIGTLIWGNRDRILRLFRQGNKVVVPGGRKTPPDEIQKQVFSRAKYRCQWKGCYVTLDLQIHHIDKNPANNNINNLICLCPNHHKRADRNEIRHWILRDWSHGRY